MSETLVATLNVSFDTDDDGVGDKAGQNKITLQQVTKALDNNGELWASCFPSRGVSFTASVGTVRVGETRIAQKKQSVKFSDSSSVSLELSGATNVEIDHTRSVLMKKVKDNYGKTRIMPASDVTVRYDQETNSIIAESYRNDLNQMVGLHQVKIYGVCAVSYEAEYSMLYYKPYIEAPYGGYYGMAFSVGTIFGYNEYDVATLEMELDLNIKSDYVEFARVTSKIVLDAKGTWEFPPNWKTTFNNNREKVGEQRDDYPEDGEFPDHPQAGTIDASNSFVDTRVHHIVKINSIGALIHEDFNNGGDDYWAWFNPYFGDSTYDPDYEIVYADPPGGKKASSAKEFKSDQYNTTWRDVFLSVNKAELEADLQDWYPGASKYSRPR